MAGRELDRATKCASWLREVMKCKIKEVDFQESCKGAERCSEGEAGNVATETCH